MYIPESANYLQIYWQLKEKGKEKKIESRFPGVFLIDNGRAPKWKAQLSFRDKNFYGGMFEFTAKGEKEAYAAYLKLIGELEKRFQVQLAIPRLPKVS